MLFLDLYDFFADIVLIFNLESLTFLRLSKNLYLALDENYFDKMILGTNNVLFLG